MHPYTLTRWDHYMRIGIDLDGVCYDFTTAFCRTVGWDPTKVDKWEFFKDHGWTVEMFLDWCKKLVRERRLFYCGDLLPGTKEAFDALKAAGHTIHIITDRCSLDPDDSDLIMQHTSDWLAENGLEYDSVHFTGDKVAAAKDLGLDFMIDDRVENVDALLDAGFKAYLFDRPWNRASDAPRVKRWGQFVEAVRLYDLVHDKSMTITKEQMLKEVRVTSETGGMKGQKLARIGSLDPRALMEVAKVAGFGEQKYARLNYLKGYDWSLSYDACQRHLHAYWSGEDLDPESGLPHLAHAAWHCLAQLAFMIHGLGTDDRFKPDEEAA